MRIVGSHDEVERLKAKYARFRVEFGGAKGSSPLGFIQPATQQGYAGTLNLPWTVVIPRQLPRPTPVRLVGVTAEGKVEVVCEGVGP